MKRKIRNRRKGNGGFTKSLEQKPVKESINPENSLLNNVLRSLPYPFYVIDANDHTVRMANLAGFPGSTSKTSTCYSLTHKRNKPCKGPENICPLAEVKKTKKPVIVQHIHYDKKGKPINVEVHAYPITDKRGNVVQIIEYSLDITKRKKMKEKLKISEEDQRLLFNNMLSGFAYCKILVDKNNKPVDFMYLDVNDAFEKLTGLKNKDVIGKRVTEAIPGIKDSHPELFDIYGKVALTGKPAKFDIFFEPLEIWLTIFVYSPEKDYFVAVFDNITERKKAEQTLQESEKRFRISADSMLDCFGIYSAIRDRLGHIVDFRVEYVNDVACKNNNMTKDEQIGKHLLELLPAHRESGLFDQYCKMVKTGKPVIKESLVYGDIYRKQYLKRAFDIRAVKLGDGFAATWRDITERKRTEKEIERSHQRLKSSEKNLREFSRKILSIREEEKKKLAANLHDEAGSLAVDLTSALSIIEQEVKDNDLLEALKNLGQTKRAVKRQVRTLKKIATGLRPPDLDIIGLPDALRTYFLSLTKETGIKIDFKTSVDERRISDDVATALYRIAQECLINIITHAEAKKAKVKLYSRKRTVKLTISDDGKGFDVNKRLEMRKIGTRGIEERALFLGGKSVIKSIPGKGTEVIVVLPLRARQK